MNNELMHHIMKRSNELNEKVVLNAGLPVGLKKEAAKDMLSTMAMRANLSERRSPQFISFMLERFEPGTFDTNFAYEWACRFRTGEEWDYADDESKKVLEKLYPGLYKVNEEEQDPYGGEESPMEKHKNLTGGPDWEEEPYTDEEPFEEEKVFPSEEEEDEAFRNLRAKLGQRRKKVKEKLYPELHEAKQKPSKKAKKSNLLKELEDTAQQYAEWAGDIMDRGWGPSSSVYKKNVGNALNDLKKFPKEEVAQVLKKLYAEEESWTMAEIRFAAKTLGIPLSSLLSERKVNENEADIEQMRKRIAELSQSDGGLLSDVYKNYISEDIPGEVDETKQNVQDFLAKASEEQLKEIWSKFVHYGSEFDESCGQRHNRSKGRKKNERRVNEQDEEDREELELALEALQEALEHVGEAVYALEQAQRVIDSNSDRFNYNISGNMDSYVINYLRGGTDSIESKIETYIEQVTEVMDEPIRGDNIDNPNKFDEDDNLSSEGIGESKVNEAYGIYRESEMWEDLVKDLARKDSTYSENLQKEAAEATPEGFVAIYNEVFGTDLTKEDVDWDMEEERELRHIPYKNPNESKVNEQGEPIPTKKKPWEKEPEVKMAEEEPGPETEPPVDDEGVPPGDEEVPPGEGEEDMGEEEEDMGEEEEEEVTPPAPEPGIKVEDEELGRESGAEEEQEEVKIEKEYVGSKGDEFYYITQTSSDTGEPNDLIIQDAVGEEVFSATKNDLDPTNVKDFILAAIKEIGIEQIDVHLVDKYIVPATEKEVESETEEELAEEEPLDEPFGMSSEAPEQKLKYEGLVDYKGRTYPYQIKESSKNVIVDIGERSFSFDKDIVSLYKLDEEEGICLDILNHLSEKELSNLKVFEKQE